jgi:hypothetical protein
MKSTDPNQQMIHNKIKHTHHHLSEFLDVSVLLTGFGEAELQATGMVNTYYATLVAKTESSLLELFFAKAREILAMKQTDQAVGTSAELIPDSSYNGLAKKIILMWYEGTWTDSGAGAIISRESYIQGLMWTAAKTHPSGAKQPGFGSWSHLPI